MNSHSTASLWTEQLVANTHMHVAGNPTTPPYAALGRTFLSCFLLDSCWPTSPDRCIVAKGSPFLFRHRRRRRHDRAITTSCHEPDGVGRSNRNSSSGSRRWLDRGESHGESLLRAPWPGWSHRSVSYRCGAVGRTTLHVPRLAHGVTRGRAGRDKVFGGGAGGAAKDFPACASSVKEGCL